MTRNMENRPRGNRGGYETSDGFTHDATSLDTDIGFERGLVGAVLSTDSNNARRVLADLEDQDIQHYPAKLILNALRASLNASPGMAYQAHSGTGAQVALDQLLIDPGAGDPAWHSLSPWLAETVTAADPSMADWYAVRVKACAARRRLDWLAARVRSVLRDDPANARDALKELWSTARRDLPSIERGDLQ